MWPDSSGEGSVKTTLSSFASLTLLISMQMLRQTLSSYVYLLAKCKEELQTQYWILCFEAKNQWNLACVNHSSLISTFLPLVKEAPGALVSVLIPAYSSLLFSLTVITISSFLCYSISGKLKKKDRFKLPNNWTMQQLDYLYWLSTKMQKLEGRHKVLKSSPSGTSKKLDHPSLSVRDIKLLRSSSAVLHYLLGHFSYHHELILEKQYPR